MIKAGFYEADITPAIGMERPGNYFKVFIKEIREALKVRTTFITDGSVKIAIVGIDTCSVSREIFDPVQAEFPGMTILLSPSHAHNAGPAGRCKIPEYYSDLARKISIEENICGNPHYVMQVITQIISSVKMAELRAEEVILSFEKGNVEDVTFNRGFKMKNGHRATHPGKCNPDIVEPFAPIDTEVGTVGFWRKNDQSFLGCMVTFNCHGTCCAAGAVNADWPGQTVRTIKAVMGEQSGVTYVYGCAGDITQINNLSPSPVEGGPAIAEKVGVSVGAEALKNLMRANKGEISTLKVITDKLLVKRRKPSQKTVDHAIEILKKNDKESTEYLFAKQHFIAAEVVAHEPEFYIDVTAIQIGPLVIITLPGEVFCGVGLDVKKDSKFPFTWVSSLANQAIGYIPTADALDPVTGGGYETRLTAGTCAAPDTAGNMTVKALELIEQLTPDAVPTGPQIEPVTTVWSYGSNLPELE